MITVHNITLILLQYYNMQTLSDLSHLSLKKTRINNWPTFASSAVLPEDIITPITNFELLEFNLSTNSKFNINTGAQFQIYVNQYVHWRLALKDYLALPIPARKVLFVGRFHRCML